LLLQRSPVCTPPDFADTTERCDQARMREARNTRT
jgi:hypothetical protein